MKYLPIFLLLFLFSCINSDPAGPGDSSSSSSSAPVYIYQTVSVYDATNLIALNLSNTAFTIIDLRTAGEYAGGHLIDAVNIDFFSASFTNQLDLLPRADIYLIYCASGNRSGQTIPIMSNMSFQEVYNMAGGFGAWSGAGYPYTN